MHRAFTLIELLVVLAILSLLAAILFPVFASVRAKARQTACTSNLHQIGLAVALYAQDADDIVPLGGDAIDVNTNTWQNANGGIYAAQAALLRPLADVLNPYVSSKDVWRCPSDTGFDSPSFGGPVLSVHPSEFDKYGNSYNYRTELAFRQATLAGMTAYDDFPPYTEHGASEINLLSDTTGAWHGGSNEEEGRFNVLMGDGHVKTLTFDALDSVFGTTLDKPLP